MHRSHAPDRCAAAVPRLEQSESPDCCLPVLAGFELVVAAVAVVIAVAIGCCSSCSLSLLLAHHEEDRHALRHQGVGSTGAPLQQQAAPPRAALTSDFALLSRVSAASHPAVKSCICRSCHSLLIPGAALAAAESSVSLHRQGSRVELQRSACDTRLIRGCLCCGLKRRVGLKREWDAVRARRRTEPATAIAEGGSVRQHEAH